MAIKNVIVIVDDFGIATKNHFIDEGYQIDIVDHGYYQYADYFTDAYGGSFYGQGSIDSWDYLYAQDNTGLFSAFDENLDGDVSNDSPQVGPISLGPVYDRYILSSELHTGFSAIEWKHGDIALKSLFEHLDQPDETLVLAIDVDIGTPDSFSLFGDLTSGTYNFETIVNNYLADKTSWFAQDQLNFLGYSFSITSPSPDLYDKNLFPLHDIDSPIFTFAQPNVESVGAVVDASWSELSEDIITVGGWNVDPNGHSLIADNSVIDSTAILADGLVEHGTDVSSLSGDLIFGTSFATPRVMAEVINFYETYIYPLLDAGYSSIEEIWGTLVDPSLGYSGIVDYILDAISTPVEILFSGQTEYKEFRVMNDDLHVSGEWPVVVPYENAAGENTSEIVDIRLPNGANLPGQETIDFNLGLVTVPEWIGADDLIAFSISASRSEEFPADIEKIELTLQLSGNAFGLAVPVTLTRDTAQTFYAQVILPKSDFPEDIAAENVAGFTISLDQENHPVTVTKSDGSSVLPEIRNDIDEDLTHYVLHLGDDLDNVLGDTLEDRESTIIGGVGSDILYGGSSKSKIKGGSGDDIILTGSGFSSIWADAGDDMIAVGLGEIRVEGGSGDDTISVNFVGGLYNVNPNGLLENDVAVVLGLKEMVVADRSSVAIFSVAREFDSPLSGDPSLIPIFNNLATEAWGQFDVTVNGNSITVGPDSSGSPILIALTNGITLQAITVPSRSTGLHDPSDENTYVVDLYIQAFDATGVAVPIPSGTEISITSAVIGELSFIDGALGLSNTSTVQTR